jgi:DNA polymerase type B, organellar and viral
MSSKDHSRKHRQTEAAKQRARERERQPHRMEAARERRRKARTTATHARPFIAIDGEGITIGGQHRFILLAASDGSEIVDAEGLRSLACFEYLMELKRNNPAGIFVGFGFGYDATMICSQIPKESLELLHLNGSVTVGRWAIRLTPGRQFFLADTISGTSITVWDVRGYWRSSFVKACHSVLGECAEIIEHGKTQRGDFTMADLPFMRAYNQAELEYLVRLMETVKTRLHQIGIRPTRYDGAGAIASCLMNSYLDHDALVKPPDNVQEKIRQAFFGGRIECLKYGHTDSKVFVYDINSAYPAAMTLLPDWRGTWEEVNFPAQISPNSVYLIEFKSLLPTQFPQPLPYRNPNNQSLAFPTQGRGWYWSPEVQLLSEIGIPHTIIKGHVFHPSDKSSRPFRWLENVYAQRLTLSKQGDPAADLLKLGLAAVWGKLAQQAGWTAEPELKTPKWHHLASAGLTTSYVRAEMVKASWAFQDFVVAFETDSIITTSPLPVVLSDKLGEWNVKEYDSLTYLGSGLSWADKDGKEWARTAGIPRGQVNRQLVLEAARKGESFLPVKMTQFIGLGLACVMEEGWDHFMEWQSAIFNMPLRPEGKRIPWAVLGNYKQEWKRLNPTLCPVIPEEESGEYMVEWENPDQALIAKNERSREVEEALSESLNYW